MRKLNKKPNVQMYVEGLFFTMEGDQMTRLYSNEQKMRYFVSMKDNPQDPLDIAEWWQVTKKEFLDMEQTFIKVARYFGKFYEFRQNRHIMDVYKL